MLQYQIDRIDHQIADDRSQTGTFLIGPLEGDKLQLWVIRLEESLWEDLKEAQ